MVLACLSISLAARSAIAGNKGWVEVDSPHFHVLSDGKQSQAREVAFDLERLRYIFASEFPQARLDSGAPLLVFAAADRHSLQSLLPSLKKEKNGQYIAGEYFDRWDKQYAVILLDEPEANVAVYHEYVHSILHMNEAWLPDWLDEGLAEFYAYTRFDGRKIYLGAPSARAPELRYETLIPIEQLISTSPESYSGFQRVDLFYAESWALVHYAMFGPGMQDGARLARLVTLVAGGEDEKTAFQQAFGGFKEMDEALQHYVTSFSFEAAVINTPPSINDKDFTGRVLTVPETDAELAAFHMWTFDMNDAVPLAQAALKADPNNGLAHEDMGYAQFYQGQDAAAGDQFNQAYSLDGSLYLSLYAKTMLSPIARSNSAADQAQYASALQKVVQLNPQFAPAYVQLALLAVRQNNLPAALKFSQRAETLAPGRAEYHLLTGRIFLRMGRAADAASIAEFVASRWPGPDRDEAVALWNRVPAAQRPAGQALSVSVAAGLQVASGTIESEQCSGGEGDTGYQITIESGGRSLTFGSEKGFEAGFSDTIWYGADHFSLCHNLDGLRAVVYFHPASGAGSGGTIAELEIRDAFPGPNPGAANATAQIAPN